MRTVMLVLTAFLVALGGVLLGFWWAPFVAGVAIGVIIGRGRIAIPIGGVSGFISWMLPLGALQARYGLHPTASSLAAIMGFGHQAAVPVMLTLVVGTLLGLTGAWLATAARTVIPKSGG